MRREKPALVIVGSGDHAHVVLEALRALGETPIGFVDVDSRGSGHGDGCGIRVIGDLSAQLRWRESIKRCRFVAAIGDNAHRATAFARALKLGLTPQAVIHPTATLLGGCSIGNGSQICARAVIGVNARIGVNCIVNTAASVDHDSEIADHVTVGPGAHLAGRVKVGSFSHIGLAASVNEGLTIGSGALVAAGAAVVSQVPDGLRVAGVPARPMEEGR